MPKTVQLLTLFVSGSEDTEADKSAVSTVADAFNSRSGNSGLISLRVKGWPSSFRPGVSSDPQAEINHQLSQGIDIYVGIMGARFGTGTPRAGSGTEEEFLAALERFRKDSTSIRLLFYFRRTAVDPFSIDPGQLIRTQAFRKGLGELGVLFKEFDSTATFTSMFDQDLSTLIADEFDGSKWTPRDTVITASHTIHDTDLCRASVALVDGADEPGLLDYVVQFHEAIQSLNELLQGMATDLVGLTASMEARTAETTAATEALEASSHIGGSREYQQAAKRIKSAADDAAEDMDQYARAMEPKVAVYRTVMASMFESLRGGLSAAQQSREQRAETLSQLRALVEVMNSTTGQLTSLQLTIQELPDLSRSVRRAKRRTASVIGQLVAELSLSTEQAEQLSSELAPPEE